MKFTALFAALFGLTPTTPVGRGRNFGQTAPGIRLPKSPSQALLLRLSTQHRTYAQWAHMMLAPDAAGKAAHNLAWAPRNSMKRFHNKHNRAAVASANLQGTMA